MLSLINLSLTLGGRELFAPLNLQLQPGQRLGIQGPSGVGKTSLLQAIAGLLSPSGGVIHNGFTSVGYVFQQPRLLPWLKVIDNLALPLRARGWSASAARQEALPWLARLALPASCADQYPASLSGGMAQRVNVARALLIHPSLLLLDEPFSALDQALRLELSQICQHHLSTLNCALLYVSHQPSEIAMLCPASLHLTPAPTAPPLPRSAPWPTELIHPLNETWS